MGKKSVYLCLLAVVIFFFTGCEVLRTALHHDYKVNKYNKTENKEYVVVFHGIYGTEKDMKPIAEMLESKDYNIISIQYPTNSDSVETITEKYIKPVVEDLEKDRKIHFVVHSMGSGILRYYLKNNSMENLGKVVFISPPSHGSALADHVISKVLKDPLGEAVFQFSVKDDSFVNKLGDPDYECYVLIGNKTNNPLYSAMIPGKDDGMVPLDSSKLDSCAYKVVDKTTHTSILKDKRTFDEIENYLKN
ncbi:alpha/beta hydrolase [Sebaldella sp. S0638]|uniref:alpha/beta hydrolase n=1 Tax=Sebaldella sp. S0638 TaxID=2957809 RepID=UPI0020A09307|nr:alpha/beta hydrolase [Sebaldella sp. S0638]MCP1223349.1 alpha/beta hydrolase [Sebaldella sp. S0638]